MTKKRYRDETIKVALERTDKIIRDYYKKKGESNDKSH